MNKLSSMESIKAVRTQSYNYDGFFSPGETIREETLTNHFKKQLHFARISNFAHD